jgi:hypothetical protein
VGNDNLEILGMGKEYVSNGRKQKGDRGTIWIKESNKLSKG